MLSKAKVWPAEAWQRSKRRSKRGRPLPCPRLPALASHHRAIQERQTLEEAEGLLKKLGFKGSLFAVPQQQQQGAQQPPEGQ